jgi:hypothetical protein
MLDDPASAEAAKRRDGRAKRNWIYARITSHVQRSAASGALAPKYERKVQTSETLIEVAMIRLLLARASSQKLIGSST